MSIVENADIVEMVVSLTTLIPLLQKFYAMLISSSMYG
jgi:hypothetical protein